MMLALMRNQCDLLAGKSNLIFLDVIIAVRVISLPAKLAITSELCNNLANKELRNKKLSIYIWSYFSHLNFNQ